MSTVANIVAALAHAEACISAALEVAHAFGGIDGDHHKAWVIDQMVRALTHDGYAAWVRAQRAGDDGPNTYAWDEGTAP